MLFNGVLCLQFLRLCLRLRDLANGLPAPFAGRTDAEGAGGAEGAEAKGFPKLVLLAKGADGAEGAEGAEAEAKGLPFPVEVSTTFARGTEAEEADGAEGATTVAIGTFSLLLFFSC